MSATVDLETTDVASVRPRRTGVRTRVRLSVAAAAVGAAGILGATACQPVNTPQAAVQQRWGSLTSCANRIVQRESRWVPTAVSPGGGNIGLFQINKYHAGWISRELGYSWNDLKNASANAHAAKVLYDKAARQYGDGWQPWRLSGNAIRGGGCPA